MRVKVLAKRISTAKPKPTTLMKLLRILATLAFCGWSATMLTAQQPIGQWEFENGLTATVGSDLTYLDAATQAATAFGTTFARNSRKLPRSGSTSSGHKAFVVPTSLSRPSVLL